MQPFEYLAKKVQRMRGRLQRRSLPGRVLALRPRDYDAALVMQKHRVILD